MWMVPAPSGNNMDKLSRLAELAKELLQSEGTATTSKPKLSIEEASLKLQDIDSTQDPFGLWPSCLSWVVVGFALPPVLGSTWYDILLSSILAGVNFWIDFGIGRIVVSSTKNNTCKRHFQWLADWENLILGFVPGLFAQIAKTWWRSDINTTIVVVGAVALPLPGYTISVGTIELCYNRIVPGFGHLLQGIVTLVWLALGAAVGIGLVEAIREPQAITEPVILVNDLWQILMVPLLCLSLAIAFQNSYKDLGWSIACQGFAYAMSYVGSLVQRVYFGYFLGAVAFTLFANIWAIWYNRPNSILLVPAFVLSISGSIGFRGLLNLERGDQELGWEQFVRMFVVALVTLTGIMVGCTLVKPRTIL